ncbi:hypothetical protein CEY12_00085 [Chryseobacterium sp. T16E-39]|uniref:SusE domain-containing protein n=1 Tax=Chryseobacterium sp. T16E-39 TaxID=2015076 RepID=UPI000B5B3EDC|nr:SusE domain-containing protein [Chryseobacterium sp. T16E-39]ASK28599.1 hypothetical protein CEY12_00085 [Chryseobacterium sp. T16E-39]
MKHFFKILAIAFIGLLVISCDKDEDQAILGENSQGKISSDKTNVVLNEVTAGNTAISFTWVNPTYNTAIVPKRQIEFGVKGKGFKDSSVFDVSNDITTISMTHAQLNAAMYSCGATPDISNQIEIRLKTIAGTAFFYSNTINVTVTPYTPNPDLVYPKINVPGAYAGAAGYADWTPGNSPNLFSPGKDGKYRGFIYVTTLASDKGKYKFAINEDWPGNKGDDGTLSGKLKVDGADIAASAVGTHYLKVDWAGNTYSSVAANFGVIGDATPTGWNSDTDLVYNPSTKKYEIASIQLSSTGLFKFRANDDWAMKFQPSNGDQALVSGTGVQTFFNIEGTVTGDSGYKVAVTGAYKIELDLHNSANYKLTITKL